MRTLLLLLAALPVIGCTPAAPPAPASAPARPTAEPTSEPADDLVRLRIGETASVNGPKVTPLAVLEDSRCPMNARCVWAGRVRLRVRIALGNGSQVRDLTQGTPVPVADGTLELVEVQPDKLGPIAASDYRFGLRFMGGI